MMTLLLVIFGVALGSFANAVALRYDPERFLFAPSNGRSHCPQCDRKLTFWELIPVISWFALRGKCHGCKAKISPRYVIVEIVMGAVLATIPLGIEAAGLWALPQWSLYGVIASWVGILLFLMIITLVDLKHYIIPDEATIVIAVLGIVIAYLSSPIWGIGVGSYLGPYALLAGFRDSVLINHLLGALAPGIVLLGLYLITKGRGIGFGDVKLAPALGLAFGWPAGLVLVGLAFVIGTIVMLPQVFSKKASMKTAIPFGPFLAIAAVVLLAFGDNLAKAYLGIIG